MLKWLVAFIVIYTSWTMYAGANLSPGWLAGWRAPPASLDGILPA